MTTNFTIFGCCATRDIFNSKINFNYKDYFKIGVDAFHTSMISMMQKPVIYDENSIKKFDGSSRDRIRHRCSKRDFEKSYLNELKKGDYEYLILDTYFDVRQGVIKLHNQSTYITNAPYTHSSDFYKNEDNKELLTIQKNTLEYINLWVDSCDKFFNFIEKNCPDLNIVLNTVRSSTKLINNDGEIFEKKGYNRFIPNHCYRSILDEYILQNFDVDVLIFDKEHLLNADYLFGPAEIHYSYSYYEDINNQLNEMIWNNNHLDYDTCKKIRALRRKYAISLLQDEIFKNNQKTISIILNRIGSDFNKNVLKSRIIENWEHIINNNLLDGDYSILKDFMLARLDIKNRGIESNNIEIFNLSDDKCSILHPKWFKDDKGSGVVLQSNKGNFSFKLKCIGDGKLTIKLRGPDIRDMDKKRIPIFIDYMSFSVNKKELLDENKFTSFNKPHIISLDVNDDDILEIKSRWLPLNRNRISNKYK